MRFGIRLLIIVAFALLLSSPRLVDKGLADNGPEHRVRNLNLGVSGGNVNDRTNRFCCSGTLGALVRDNTGVLYILSNNHVLGLSGQANPGDDISQPGLIDTNCQANTIVADFTVAPELEPSNVDAAIAQLRSGEMNQTGEIEDIGVPSSTVATPSVGMSVAKSGRTTGFTTGTISSINTTVNVQYTARCGGGKRFTVNYTGQVVIGGAGFSAGGDSGSLIVTNNSSHNPVALLYAGSSSTTIGNPAGEVLTRLSAALGRTVSFVGTGSASVFDTLASNSPIQQDVDSANAAKERHEQEFMLIPGVIGMGVGGDTSGESAIVVYIDRTRGRIPALPARVDNIKVLFVLTDPFVAF
jgi:hypothetical protein